jgi:hypothetical protein
LGGFKEKAMDDKLLQRIRMMADDVDWTVRENAASEIKNINDKQFTTYLPVWREWVSDPNPNIRRAVEGCVQAVSRAYQIRESVCSLEHCDVSWSHVRRALPEAINFVTKDSCQRRAKIRLAGGGFFFDKVTAEISRV